MRTYVNTIIFEGALDSVPPQNTILYSVIDRMFSPSVDIIEEDCETLLGDIFPISVAAQGLIELATNNPLNTSRLASLITTNNVEVAVRSTSTCLSVGGVCRRCLRGSRPGITVPAVGSKYKLFPEIIIDTGTVTIETGQTSGSILYSANQFDKLYAYSDGTLIDPSTYSITGNSFVLNSVAGSNISYFLKYVVITNSQFFYWLANTYSGSLLGISPLDKKLLPLRKEVLLKYIPQEDIEVLISQLKSSEIAEEDSVQYLDSITDPVEKAVFVVTLCSIFLNR